MVFTVKDLDEALGAVLSKTLVTEVKNVIGTYEQTKSAKENIKLLTLAHKKEILLETVNFLKSLGTDYPVPIQQLNPDSRLKEDYATDIVSFINLLKPTQCLACSTNYVPTGEDYNESKVKCFICKRPSHHNCYDDAVAKPEIGIVFLCSECISEKTAKDLADTKVPPTPTLTSKPPVFEDVELVDNDKDAPIIDNQPQDDKDCPLYLKRKCPHGLTGKRLVNGKSCPHRHRKLCKYFMQYGPAGCRFKRQCRFLHPHVCENSIKLKTCLNKSCSEFHLKGTQRRAVNASEPNLQQRRQSEPVQPWSQNVFTPHVPETIHQKQNTSQGTKDFLERYLQEMKAEMKEFTRSVIKESLRVEKTPATTSHPSQQPPIEETYQPQQTQRYCYQPQNLPIQNPQFQPMSILIPHQPTNGTV